MFPRGRKLLLGVAGGISAYKSCDLLRRLQDEGFIVDVVPTAASLNFVGKATWEALSGRNVVTDLWSDVTNVPHISLAKESDLIVIAPATADLLAKLASGRADDLLTNIVLASTSPKILVPAMHPEMWSNAATVENIKVLKERGFFVVEPAEGRMTGSDFGVGRYPDTVKIIEAVNKTIEQSADLTGKRILITAGGTREPIDPIRFIGNRSSGKQGFALAMAAASRGAQVHLVTANTDLPIIEGITTTAVETADQMAAVLAIEFPHCDALIMSAAVADAKVLQVSDHKLEKSQYSEISLEPTVDILKSLGQMKEKKILVGFAAQTGSDGLLKAIEKYSAKNVDLLYVNDVSGGAIFGKDMTSGSIIDEGVVIESVNEIPKVTLAHKLLDLARNKLSLPND